MQMTITLLFDLDTVQGRITFAQLQQLFLPTTTMSVPSAFTPPDVASATTPDLAAQFSKVAETIKANRQAAAANARAAKAAKDALHSQADARKPGPIEKVLEPEPDLNGDAGDQLVEDEDLGLSDGASMSPGEARDAGLALVRQVYAAGKVAEVKALQKEWQVAKFYDVPLERGHEFYARVVKMAQSVGLQP